MSLVTDDQVGAIRSYRHEMRLAGCWGACYEVACFIEQAFGWRRMDGVYALADGRPVFYHSWNILADGAICDGTADQFGEGEDVAILAGDALLKARYREKYTAAHNPLSTSWLVGRPYAGVPDQVFWDAAEAAGKLRPGWWLSDRAGYLAWFKDGASQYPMFATMRDRYRERGYDATGLV